MTAYHRVKGGRKWTIAAIAAAALVAASAISYYFYSQVVLRSAKGPSSTLPVSREEKISAALFFSSATEDYLVAENRLVPKKDVLGAQVKDVLRELIVGPTAGNLPVLSGKTRVRDVFIDSNGTAYVDFTRDMSADFPGGSWNELAAVYSVVNTLSYNFPEIKRVQIMIEGSKISTLAGHIDTGGPIEPRMGLVKPGEGK